MEMIVVIVVLGILAAVTVPAYSGYVKRAHAAADNELIGAINAAFAAACAEGGQHPATVPGVRTTLAITTEGELAQKPISAVDTDASRFDAYYDGNGGAKFQYYTLLRYDTETGAYSGETGTASARYGDAVVTVSQGDRDAFSLSAFFGLDNDPDKDSMTELMGEVDNVTDGAAQFLGANSGTAGQQVAADPHFRAFLTGLGFSPEDIDKLGDNSDPKNTEMLANALVLYTASRTKELNAEQMIDNFLNGNGSWASIESVTSSNVDVAIGKTIPYAMMLAYANSEIAKEYTIGGKPETVTTYKGEVITDSERTELLRAWWALADETKDGFDCDDEGNLIYNGQPAADTLFEYQQITTGGTPVKDYFSANHNITSMNDINALEKSITSTDGFKAYMATDQARADLQGFLSAMNMLDANAKSVGAQNLMENGFQNEDLITMLNNVLH